MPYRNKLALLINIVSPYRLPIYVKLGKVFQTRVIISGQEDNSLKWKGMEQSLVRNGISVKIAKGITFRYKNSTKEGKTFEKRNLHINLGYIFILSRDKPDVVISIEMGFRTAMALLYGCLFRKPVWVWWGGTLHTERNRNFIKRWFRWGIARLAQHWISYGKTSTDYLLNIGVKRERIVQIQNCVDETLYNKLVEPAYIFQPKPVLLFAGRFVMLKGLDFFLEAVARLQAEGYRFSTLLVGDGPEKESMQRLANDLHLESIFFIPPQPPEVMSAVYRSADAFVFPTLNDVWGLVINESLWSGVPVLSSIYAGCTPEIVPPENRFDPLDPQDFDRALRLVLEKKIKPADTTPLLPSDKVASMIIEDIQKYIGVEDENTAL
ncbi:MAG: glycosyltransferase family 4 protein [Bellilinea sp.]